MKIEIGESLALTYLKHIEGCQIVQTNWKTSGNWIINPQDKKNAKYLFNSFKKSPLGKDVFGRNSFEQFLKQAEIDLIGINLEENSIFGIEVATHLTGVGLNYKNTRNNVAKKIIRNILVMQCYFKDFSQYNMLFITPKTNEKTAQEINEIIEEINKIIDDEAINIDFVYNQNFYKKLVDPILLDDFTETDSNELFLRAVSILKLNNYFTPTFSSKKDLLSDSINKMKIGQLVQKKMKELEEKGLLSKEEKEKLLTKEYSKEVFNQDFQILRHFSKGNKDQLGRNRYYKDLYFECYFLTSQWYERHREPFLKWVRKIENK